MFDNQNAAPRVELNEMGRLEAFSDGVFAIAITLLILEIRVSHELPAGVTLWDSVLGQRDLFAAFLAGFCTIGIMWINHHRLFELIYRSDSWLKIINLLLLLGITFLNYPTALLGNFFGTAEGTTAMGIYAGTTVVCSMWGAARDRLRFRSRVRGWMLRGWILRPISSNRRGRVPPPKD